MRNRSKILCLSLTALLFFCVANTEAKPKQTKLYVFGVSINFTDSVTYLTDIQTLNEGYIETKTGFMYDRSIYSQQLQIWIEYNKQSPGTTCAIFFSKNRAQLGKKYLKIRNKYSKDRTTRLEQLDAGEFKFIQQEWSEHEKL